MKEYKFPKLVIEEHEGFYVVRDDLLEGGSASVHELNTDYYNTSMFDLSSTFLDGNVNISDKD